LNYPSISYGLWSARELGAASGGKNVLLGYYDYLRIRSKLASTLAGKRTVVMICLDKDLDDLTRTLRRSNHVIYTENFDVESYLFRFGDLVVACSAAAELDPQDTQRALAPVAQWPSRVSSDWVDWVIISVFEITTGCTVCGNYSRCPPPINPAGPVDQALLASHLTQLQQVSNLPNLRFRRRFARIRKSVLRLFAEGNQDRVFKGKWYAWLMARDLRNAYPARDIDFDALESRLPTHLVQSLNFDAAWADPLVHRFSLPIQTHLTAA
jgi:hypothetical protein